MGSPERRPLLPGPRSPSYSTSHSPAILCLDGNGFNKKKETTRAKSCSTSDVSFCHLRTLFPILQRPMRSRPEGVIPLERGVPLVVSRNSVTTSGRCNENMSTGRSLSPDRCGITRLTSFSPRLLHQFQGATRGLPLTRWTMSTRSGIHGALRMGGGIWRRQKRDRIILNFVLSLASPVTPRSTKFCFSLMFYF